MQFTSFFYIPVCRLSIRIANRVFTAITIRIILFARSQTLQNIAAAINTIITSVFSNDYMSAASATS